MTSVSSVERIVARSGIADVIDAGIRVTPPYGKSRLRGQMRHAIAAMRVGATQEALSPSGMQGYRI
jgi:hypothetical protein